MLLIMSLLRLLSAMCCFQLSKASSWYVVGRGAACSLINYIGTAGLVTSADRVAVVGSSHSAVLVLMNLLEMDDGPKVLNLYRSPLRYAKYRDDGVIILDNTGLKVQHSIHDQRCFPGTRMAGLQLVRTAAN